MNKDSAKAAAKWWADQLRGGAKLDNGDESRQGGMAMMLGLLAQSAERKGRDTGKVDAFEEALARRFEAIDDGKWKFPIAGVDYHPDRHLVEAAEEVGLDLGMASPPWKTSMYSLAGKVTVYCGYRAPEEVVYDPAAQTALTA